MRQRYTRRRRGARREARPASGHSVRAEGARRARSCVYIIYAEGTEGGAPGGATPEGGMHAEIGSTDDASACVSVYMLCGSARPVRARAAGKQWMRQCARHAQQERACAGSSSLSSLCVRVVVCVCYGLCLFGSVRVYVSVSTRPHTQSLMSLLGVSEARSLIRDLWVRFVLSLHFSKGGMTVTLSYI